MNTELSQSAYRYVWHKYRPVILRLMVDSEKAPQQYAFSDHEFKRVFPRKHNSLAFILFIHRSKALNNIKSSPLAQALLGILQESKTVVRLTEDSTYELILDENFIFHVRKNEKIAGTADVSDPALSLSVTQ